MPEGSVCGWSGREEQGGGATAGAPWLHHARPAACSIAHLTAESCSYACHAHPTPSSRPTTTSPTLPASPDLVQRGAAQRVEAHNEGGDAKGPHTAALRVTLLHPRNVPRHVFHAGPLIQRQPGQGWERRAPSWMAADITTPSLHMSVTHHHSTNAHVAHVTAAMHVLLLQLRLSEGEGGPTPTPLHPPHLWLCASMRALLMSTRASAVSPANARQMWSSIWAILRTVWATCGSAGVWERAGRRGVIRDSVPKRAAPGVGSLGGWEWTNAEHLPTAGGLQIMHPVCTACTY